MQCAALNHRCHLGQIQLPGKYPPGFIRQPRQQRFHFLAFTFRGRTGNRQLFFRPAGLQSGDQLDQLFRRQFLPVIRGERAEMKVRSRIRRRNIRRLQMRRLDVRMKFRGGGRETDLFQATAILHVNGAGCKRLLDHLGEHLPPERRAATPGIRPRRSRAPLKNVSQLDRSEPFRLMSTSNRSRRSRVTKPRFSFKLACFGNRE